MDGRGSVGGWRCIIYVAKDVKSGREAYTAYGESFSCNLHRKI